MAVDLPTLPTVVVVEQAPASARALSTLREPEARALGVYRDTMGLRLLDLPEQPPAPTLPIDGDRPARLARVERALHEARGALDPADARVVADVRGSLALAYAEVRAHPEDPEAPFLAGECLRTLARVEELAGDGDGARALRARAATFDGGRSLGLSEGGPLEEPSQTKSPFTLTLLDAPVGALAWVDGERDSGTLGSGEHHLRVVAADGRTLAARWFFASGTGLEVRLGATRVRCTADDLAPALSRLAADPQASFAVACPAWLRVATHASSLELRICSARDCGAPSNWSTVPVLPVTTPVAPVKASILRSGWTWTAVGAAVAAGTLTAWSLGAFDRDKPAPPIWRWEGAK